MNLVLADRIVLDHTQSLLADAARARLVRQAARGRKRHARTHRRVPQE